MDAVPRLDEQTRLGPVRAVGVAERLQRPRRRLRLLEITDARHHVDDRLRRQTAHRGRSDVVDAAAQPRVERLGEQCALSLEPARPAGVVGNDDRSYETAACAGRSARRYSTA